MLPADEQITRICPKILGGQWITAPVSQEEDQDERHRSR